MENDEIILKIKNNKRKKIDKGIYNKKKKEDNEQLYKNIKKILNF